MAVVGRIPYLNCALFFDRWGEGGPVLLDLPPRQLGEEARAGRVDAGVMAMADVFGLEGTFEPLGNLGIGCPERAASVFLFSRRPMADLGGATVGVTGETATSVRLLKVLLQHRYGLSGVRYTTPDDPRADAILLIGDAALRAKYQQPQPWPLRVDLGEEWVAWQGLPFVFARWVVRSSLSEQEKRQLESHVAVAYEEGNRFREAIGQARAARLGLPPRDVLEYFDVFRFELTGEDERGIERFRALLRETPGA